MEVAQDLQMSGFEGFVFGLKIMLDIAHAQPYASRFVAISRADAFARRTHFVFAFGGFVGAVEHTVGGQDEVGAATDVQAVGDGVAGRLQFLRFAHEEVGRNDAAVADDIDFIFVEDAGGNGTKHKLLSIEDDGVSGIGAAGKTRHEVVLGREEIDHLSLALVAEDDAEEGIYFSFCHD